MVIIGIDLGTTHSLAAVWQEGHSVIIPNSLGQSLTPSIVSMDSDGTITIGEPAKVIQHHSPARCAANFKRYMGTARNIFLGDRSFRPEELSAMVLKQLKEDAERFLGAPVTEAVISVPAYFSDAQRKATKMAGELAGLRVERLINEPTAAALAYGLHHQDDEHSFLIFDLGGGTFDVSILELFDNVMEVRASAGDNFLGGEDIVDLLIDAFKKQLPPLNIDWHNPDLQQRLREEAERVKCALSTEKSSIFSILIDDELREWTLCEDQFQILLEPLFLRIRAPLERAMRDAKVDIDKLDQVVLVGGSTRMPLIRQLVTRMFGRMPAMHLHPDEVVAQGAAIQAALKAKHVELRDIVVTDVCPYSLGIEVAKEFGRNRGTGYFMPIIARNQSVPISREQSFQTSVDMQTQVDVNIYQGESRMAKDNILLGHIAVHIPPRKAGEVEVIVRFTYDISGLIVIDVTIPISNEKYNLVIEQNAGLLTDDERDASLQRLNQFKVHPKNQPVNQALLARLENLYRMSLGDQRDWVSDCTVRFEHLLQEQDEKPIAEFREQVNGILDSIDSERLL